MSEMVESSSDLIVLMEAHIGRLQGQLAPIDQRANDLRVEIGKAEKAVAVLRSAYRLPSPRTPQRVSQRGPTLGTIQSKIETVLREHPEGLRGSEVADAVNSRFGCNLARTSVAPQLSRLKFAGRVRQIGLLWSLAALEPRP